MTLLMDFRITCLPECILPLPLHYEWCIFMSIENQMKIKSKNVVRSQNEIRNTQTAKNQMKWTEQTNKTMKQNRKQKCIYSANDVSILWNSCICPSMQRKTAMLTMETKRSQTENQENRQANIHGYQRNVITECIHCNRVQNDFVNHIKWSL